MALTVSGFGAMTGPNSFSELGTQFDRKEFALKGVCVFRSQLYAL